jgi:hypothetical protein
MGREIVAASPCDGTNVDKLSKIKDDAVRPRNLFVDISAFVDMIAGEPSKIVPPEKPQRPSGLAPSIIRIARTSCGSQC